MLAIGQGSHAWISGQLARGWGNEQFPAPRPREEVCLAAAQHDVGWWEWDLQPTLDEGSGRPHSFLDLPDLSTHIGLWRSAPDKLLMQNAYAALLVSMHGTALYARREPGQWPSEEAELVKRYLDGERARQENLKQKLHIDETELARNQRLLWTWDSMSLAVCIPWDPHTATRVPAGEDTVDIEMHSVASDRFVVRPWPFTTGELAVRCDARRITQRFTDQAAMRKALSEAPVETLEFTLTQ